MTLGQKQSQFFEHICLLRQYAVDLGFRVVLGEVQRSLEQQKIYYFNGRSKTMESDHLNKLAADIHFF